MTFRATLSNVWNNIQYLLFPLLEERLETTLAPKNKRVAAVLELVRIEEFLPCTRFCVGRPSKDRACLARAFIAKIVLGISYTKHLRQYLQTDISLKCICGWDKNSQIPSESKFSRAYNEFAEAKLPEKVHQALISEVYKDKIIGHLVKDSTPILAREKHLKKKGTYEERKKAANNRYLEEKKGNRLSRRKKQLDHQSLEEMIHDLPKSCDIGRKKNAAGITTAWKGYKLHTAVDDHCVPIAAILTSASLNDCEAAIPLGEKSHRLVRNFYDLMDSAYDVSEIKEHSSRFGHVAIIDKHCRSYKEKAEKTREKKAKGLLNYILPEDRRYQERMPKERFHALFKDFYGGRSINYKGYTKIFCGAMFGILALTATTLLNLIR